MNNIKIVVNKQISMIPIFNEKNFYEAIISAIVNKQISMILIFNDKSLYEAIINTDSKQTYFNDSYFQ